ncbi:MAG TPA: PhnD/SsuA/transferrin family substrate-binding protein [Gemmataceae bacterium]|nr:PhnD/SsuA/transferrin family substrate-binding protein [Gemmataceae bacterium]
MRYLIVALVAAAFVVPASAQDKPAAAVDAPCCCQDGALKVGAVAYSPDSVTIFRAMRLYFARNNMPIEFVLYSTYDGLNEALEKKQVDVAWNSPLGHAKFHLKAGDSQALVMRDVDVSYKVKLVVRKDAGIKTLDDLAGKAMVFGSCDSADSTVLPVYFLRKAGVKFDAVKLVSLHNEVDEIGCPCHSQHHVLAAVLKGRGQAGIISGELWKKLQKDQPEKAEQLKEVWESPGFSHCVFTARKDFSKETAEKFSKLMLAMDGKDSLTAEILKGEHCQKWVPAGKAAQDGYADLLAALRERQPLPVTLLK